MTAKINKLTQRQITVMPEWFEKWVAVGLSTEPADFDAAERALRACYRAANLAEPKVVLRMGSPLAACLGGAYGAWMLGSQVRDQVWSQVRDQVESQVRSQVWSQVGSQVGSQVRFQVRDQVWSQVGSQVWPQVGSQHRGGNLWAGWYSYVSFLRDVCGWENKSLTAFAHDEQLAVNCSWQWYHHDIAAITDRPKILRRDIEGRLHCETGPALAYRDGWVIHCWHGVVIPAEWIEQRDKLTPKMALTWTNVEQRRVACEILGWDKVLDEPSLNPRIIDRDEPYIGTLISVDLPDAPNQWFIKYRCGTGRWFAESVNDKQYNTALAANAAGNGWRGRGDPMSFIPFIRT